MLDFINDQAMNTPDIPDRVPFVAGQVIFWFWFQIFFSFFFQFWFAIFWFHDIFFQVRGKKWVPPPQPKDNNFGLGLDDSIELDIDLGDETEKALIGASTSDIIDLAGMNTFLTTSWSRDH